MKMIDKGKLLVTFAALRNTNNGGNDAFINFDRDFLNNGTKATVGYGVYKFTIITDTLVDTFSVEWDAAFPYRPEGLPWTSDLELLFTDIGTPNILFKWSGDSLWHELSEVGGKIVAWDQQYSDSGFRRLRQKDYGNFRYDTVRSLTLNVFPLDSRKNCGDENHTFHDNRSGLLTLNLLIDKNIHTRDTLIDLPTNILITDGAALKINNSKILDIISPSNSGTNAYNNLIVQDSSFLILYGYSKIILHQPNKLTLQHGSNLTLGNYSEMIIKNGAKFCNEGGNIREPGHIIYENGIHNTCEFDNFTASDSANIVLDSATLSLPDDYTLHLKGNETALILNPGSKLLFGVNSGIVCDSGARLIANDAVFASVDSTKKWNGISLSDPSSDTIRNCTIKNAMYGIALSGKYDPDESLELYSTEIFGCSL